MTAKEFNGNKPLNSLELIFQLAENYAEQEVKDFVEWIQTNGLNNIAEKGVWFQSDDWDETNPMTTKELYKLYMENK